MIHACSIKVRATDRASEPVISGTCLQSFCFSWPCCGHRGEVCHHLFTKTHMTVSACIELSLSSFTLIVRRVFLLSTFLQGSLVESWSVASKYYLLRFRQTLDVEFWGLNQEVVHQVKAIPGAVRPNPMLMRSDIYDIRHCSTRYSTPGERGLQYSIWHTIWQRTNIRHMTYSVPSTNMVPHDMIHMMHIYIYIYIYIYTEIQLWRTMLALR